MAKDFNLAYPYAKALYINAKESGKVDYWLNLLKELAKISENENFTLSLANPKVTKDLLVQLVLEILQDKSIELVNFLNLIANNRRFSFLPEIYSEYTRIFQSESNIALAIIESAYPISATDKIFFEDKLSRKFDKNIRVETKINNDLIGGIKIIIGDIVIDSSVSGGLKLMATQILR